MNLWRILLLYIIIMGVLATPLILTVMDLVDARNERITSIMER
jgi:hypothetical protein